MATTSLDTVFHHLRDQLTAYVPPLIIRTDGPDVYRLNATQPNLAKEISFAYLKIGKAYVSYHLVPLYGNPSLLDGVSLELRKRMQGKTCFNFKAVDETLFAELNALTERSFQRVLTQEFVA